MGGTVAKSVSVKKTGKTGEIYEVASIVGIVSRLAEVPRNAWRLAGNRSESIRKRRQPIRHHLAGESSDLTFGRNGFNEFTTSGGEDKETARTGLSRLLGLLYELRRSVGWSLILHFNAEPPVDAGLLDEAKEAAAVNDGE